MPVQIAEFPVGGDPIPIARGSDGNLWMWFSGTTSIARLTPAGSVSAFNGPVAFPASLPGHCVDGHDGGMWCSNTGGPIARADIATGVITSFAMPPGAGATDLTLGPDGALWFTDFGLNAIGRMTLAGVVTEFPVPAAFVAPRSITVGPDHALWFTSDAAQVGRLDTNGQNFFSYDLPEHPTNIVAQFSAITTGIDGNLWLGVLPDSGPGKIVRVTPSGVITEIPLPDANGALVDIVSGPDGALWFTEQQANKIGRVTVNGLLTDYPLAALAGPTGITVGPDRAIWFTEIGTQSVGRVSGGPLAVAPVPTLAAPVLALLAASLAAAGWVLLRRS